MVNPKIINKIGKSAISKGSILIFTLIIMAIMLATAISIAAVAIKERKGAGTAAQSTQAFAVADSGSEIALKAAENETIIQDLGINCNNGTVTVSVPGGTADVTFYSNEEATTALACGDSAGSARKVKSVGIYAGTARAVEVAVAAEGIISCDFYEINRICGAAGTSFCAYPTDLMLPQMLTYSTFQKVCDIVTDDGSGNGGFGIAGTYKSCSGSKVRRWDSDSGGDWGWSDAYDCSATLRRISGAYCCK